MLGTYGIIREVSRRIAEAANRAIADYANTAVEHEAAITDRMLGRITEAITGFQSKGIVWQAKTLTTSKSGQEQWVGADFAGVLKINLPDFRIQKGFLAQAKRLGLRDQMPPSRLRVLQEQCRSMLKHTPDCFVFLYSEDRVTIIPASSVIATRSGRLHDLYSRTVQSFFEEHLASFIGDLNIDEPSKGMVENMIAKTRTVLVIEAKK